MRRFYSAVFFIKGVGGKKFNIWWACRKNNKKYALGADGGRLVIKVK